ncbi:hypothetical protein EVAR_44663_1 [Eumeta japonica]|uniref:Uncharacterized protein n=1 Tax=Eumeta variegata TaxID=151549 RepID=A0A4C1XJ78_EUMVA|nr:hypothetical protein EVAR_44663_1 [Eumeta japonica]
MLSQPDAIVGQFRPRPNSGQYHLRRGDQDSPIGGVPHQQGGLQEPISFQKIGNALAVQNPTAFEQTPFASGRLVKLNEYCVGAQLRRAPGRPLLGKPFKGVTVGPPSAAGALRYDRDDFALEYRQGRVGQDDVPALPHRKHTLKLSRWPSKFHDSYSTALSESIENIKVRDTVPASESARGVPRVPAHLALAAHYARLGARRQIRYSNVYVVPRFCLRETAT